ncbi:salicylate synthase [Streptomyces luteolus]|uniref:Salicylate synthase n=1 Tax=Streptomyces luteolus TaxID=3043615 RepID=A0ABT6SVF0_9ACTN|nr:salicylate synthase [Streptomyces sp. B-S-A12]MDI3419580.1 salicylate synthase [Streptomyces sp. B-S-A12]
MTLRHHYRETETAAPSDPLLTVARLAETHDPAACLVYEREDTWHYCAGAIAEIIVDHRHVHYSIGTDRRSIPWRGHPLPVVAQLLDALPIAQWRAYGWAAFELALLRTAGVPARRHPGRPATAPLLHLVVPRDEVRITAGRTELRSTDASSLAALEARLTEAVSGSALPIEQGPGVSAAVDLSTGGDAYRTLVAGAVDEIGRGSYDKVVLSRVVPVPHPVDLVNTFVLGRRNNTPARSFLLRLAGLGAAGFSPELVVTVSADGLVRTQPLAGTRARTACAAENGRLRAELLADVKEIHEHEISVTAATEELATVCTPDTITLDEYLTVKERGSVQHLASRLSGRLAPGLRCWDAFTALFPAITVSGVPKAAAVADIARMEAQPRGMYGGAVLTAAADGSLDATLVLRAVFEQGGRTWLRAGAGVVRQSDPAREMEETCEKLRSIAAYLVPERVPAAR